MSVERFLESMNQHSVPGQISLSAVEARQAAMEKL
jgi:hypothetical protein